MMNQETVALLEQKLREEEHTRKELERRLWLAQSDVLTYGSSVAESDRIIFDLQTILGRSAGDH
jgi:hypothetical protein